eukprot:CAMPEP_0113726648 /NCGR_PEP_ID=MMETSP0038_2-20120614/40588_1 /TAXON_ID=2898 /ORGANISM="Cryptomonas paramecium" /LENGTH=49 /DNA_ID=CAMNT_0000657357 /DNA_START=25 /DNA_END=170 /DNA_ORIENTATION=- /assembly_acc=CAM_ASM_000170
MSYSDCAFCDAMVKSPPIALNTLYALTLSSLIWLGWLSFVGVQSVDDFP